MRIDMTLEAVGELMMYLSTMRFSMTLLTPWYLTMMRVTGCTVEITVLGMIPLQILVNLGMT